MSATAPPRQHAGRHRITPPPTVIAVLEALAVVALILFLTRQMIFAPRSVLSVGDFPTHAWYIHHQAETLRATHMPSLFLHGSSGAFYPIFMFYGGTLFVAGALLSLLPGSSNYAAGGLLYAAAFAAAYGGWYWLARMAGVGRWLAHVPSVVYVTAPGVLTVLYVSQDLPEFVATAVMPLMVASALSVGRADSLRLGPAAALAASTIAFTGSHNLTLLWGTLFLAFGTAAIVAVVPSARTLIPLRGALRILAVVVPAVAVNAWFLLPDLFYSHDTAIAHRAADARARLRYPIDGATLTHLLSPGRPDLEANQSYTLPVLALAWALLTAAIVRPRRSTPWPRLIVVLALSTLALAVFIDHVEVLAHLPSPFVLTQYGSRLITFPLCAICGALIAALALARPPALWLGGLLTAVLVVGLFQTADQLRYVDRSAEPVRADLPLDGLVSFGLGDYSDGTSAIFRPRQKLARVTVGHGGVVDGRTTFTLPGRPGRKFLINVMAPAALIHVEGAKVIGRWAAPPANPGWLPRWYLAMQIPEDAKGQRHEVVITAARTAPIVAGEIISILGLLGLLAIAARITYRRLAPPRPRGPRPRRRSAAAPSSATPGRG